MNIVIIGTNGLVGHEFVKLLESDYNYKNITFVGSEKSKGSKFQFRDDEFTMITLDEVDWNNSSIYINCADKQQAIDIKNNMKLNSILIDNSSQFRLYDNIPLVIPEINFPSEIQQIYANPNCSTIILDLLLKPLDDVFGVKRVVVSTYQAASGAGKVGLEELVQQSYQKANSLKVNTNYWGKQYVYNTFVHNSSIQDNFYNEEENKIIKETKKILRDDIKITATAIRVPVIRSHCESVNVELLTPATSEQIYNVLHSKNYLEVIDDKSNRLFPESITSNNKLKVQVGHIRQDESLEDGHGWNFWISGDQLLRGAAYNAYLIMNKINEKINDKMYFF